MMQIEVLHLPKELASADVGGRSVVVFDVLRATTTMATALAAGAAEVRIFGSLDAAMIAARQMATAGRLVCGEHRCLRPEGFDLGNSPGDFTPDKVSGKTVFLSTTNGTRAIVAARGAEHLLAAALVNAAATARALRQIGKDVVLVCAGTNGEVAPEDIIGAGAVIDGLVDCSMSDTARAALELFRESQDRMGQVLRNTDGGRNITRAGLEPDIDFAARIDAVDIAVIVRGEPPVAQRMIEPC